MDIQIEGVHQSFKTGFLLKERPILNGVTVAVKSGTVFGFLGANGAGKTTLIHLITGIKKPKQGKVLIQNHPAHTAEARRLIGYLPERPYFHEALTAQQMLEYFGALSGMTKTEVAARIEPVLRSVGMEKARHIELKKYSKGMLQRMGIAAAILHDPQIVILDEPMSGLDPVGRKEIRELIQNLKNQKKTVFFSTHVVSDVEAICDQVAIIRSGKIETSGNVDEMLAQVSKGIMVRWKIAGHPKTHQTSLPMDADVNKILTEIMAQGGQIQEVSLERASLEHYFGEAAFARTH